MLCSAFQWFHTFLSAIYEIPPGIKGNDILPHIHSTDAIRLLPDDYQNVLPVPYSSDVLFLCKPEMCNNDCDVLQTDFCDAFHLPAALPDICLPSILVLHQKELPEEPKSHSYKDAQSPLPSIQTDTFLLPAPA